MLLRKRPEVDRFLREPSADIRGALIFGKDRSGVRERAEALSARVTSRPDDPFDVALLSDGDVERDGGRLEEELSALSLMGGRRLVRLKLFGEKAAVERACAEALARHDKAELNPDAFFLIEAGALEASSALRRAAEKAASLVCIAVYDDEGADLSRMVRESLAKDRLSLQSDALELFVSRLPKERALARSEIERLALYLGPGSGVSARASDLADFLGVEPEASLFEAAEDAFGARAAKAQSGLRRARSEGEGGAAAVRALSQHLARLRRGAQLVADGAAPPEAAKTLRVFWKSEREYLRQLAAWPLADLEALSADLLEADLACKTTGAPDHLISERLALSIAARARRLGL